MNRAYFCTRHMLNKMSSSMNNSLEWRRNKVLELSSQGNNESEIARILQVSQPTINRDILYAIRQKIRSKNM